ncbi:MAG TPA: hypothetical protein DCQ84_07470 [Candidatus Competibacteraceae bacterium]|nr:hypothetical protein [Candidatus Competibacteraceae bacterium]
MVPLSLTGYFETLMIHIRQATVQDVPIVLPLVAEYWNFEGLSGFQTQLVASQLERLFSEPSLGVGWIAWSSESTVGYLLAVFVFSLEDLGITAEIDEFFVRPEYRGNGVGTKLLAVAEAEMLRVGCTSVSLHLARRNDSARAFYRQHDYIE